ncbi:MAG: hypothetical protein JW882_14765 [Deltaproteobacteria bacterium]|nr:hypothetical protein [Deltaproteobacteria bacterium]
MAKKDSKVRDYRHACKQSGLMKSGRTIPYLPSFFSVRTSGSAQSE